ncbi:hypothetical protein Bra3105_03840 [Brachybacterium halotolerans subsp. kimchii]|uniref:hypothetical protein n=1 Tax=Brachybacterium halotolerans TaxID=2795215 RepID=UPI001E392EAC|nr:hypothetical protein [Brachybacterium halotolerans]UEJ83455.1 hypothetical protein Bra3105_03840 [Brachybacterium halotolerans subsp. kimchii]
MTRTIRTLAFPVFAALLLAGCGSTEDQAAPATTQSQQSDGGAASSDGEDLSDTNGVEDPDALPTQAGVTGEECAPDLWDEIEGVCLDESAMPPIMVEGAFGFSEGGATYTLGTPEDLPADVADALKGIDVSEADLAKIKVIPVEIDNTEGNSTETLYGATAVTEGGDQHEWLALGGYLFDVSDKYAEENNSGLGDPPFDAVNEFEEASWKEVVPTAKDTQYLVVDDGTDLTGTFTYMEMEGGETGGSPFPIFPKIS